MASRFYTIAAALTAMTAFIPSALSAGPESSPHNYTGIPTVPLGPQWQNYYEVTAALPNITFALSRSFAGNIPVGRPNHPEDTFYFWAFEKNNGSLTAAAGENSDEPWGIWLNGGPGTSSLYGFHFENGPIRINADQSASPNNYSFEKVADFFWIDQPVGVGFSTADATGYVSDEDQMATDFIGFLTNLVKVFPSLATRPLTLTGESYAGVYIPYIMKAYFAMANPPVKVVKLVMGNPSIGSDPAFMELPAVTVLETYPQIIGYDLEVLNYFQEQSQLCNYTLNLTYPQPSTFPSIPLIVPDRLKAAYGVSKRDTLSKRGFHAEVAARHAEHPDRSLHPRSKELKRRAWKRDNLDGRAKGKVDDWYACLLLEEAIDYAVNFTFPWTLSQPSGLGFNIYNIPDALYPPKYENASVFLNDNRTRTALHAPINKDWTDSIEYPYGSTDGKQDPSIEPMVFLSDLATNLTAHNIGVVLYSGNDDSLIPHHGTEISIQNTTFGGIRGFTRKPSTPWHDANGNLAGIIHQERGWTYVLFKGAGHLVPQTAPASMFTFLQQFVFGTNQTGLVTTSPSGVVAVNGGEDPTLSGDILPGQDEIYYGPGVTQSTYVFPQATISAWRSIVGPETATVKSKPTGASNGGLKVELSMAMCLLPLVAWVIS